MDKIGKYIYGIIDRATFLYLSTPKNFFEVGKNRDNNGVYTIPYRDISALVKDSEIVNYTQLPKDAVARLLVEHQMVIEKIMGLETAITPMRLGTFAQDEVEVRYILNKGYSLIKNITGKINNRIEIDRKIEENLRKGEKKKWGFKVNISVRPIIKEVKKDTSKVTIGEDYSYERKGNKLILAVKVPQEKVILKIKGKNLLITSDNFEKKIELPDYFKDVRKKQYKNGILFIELIK